MDLRYLRYFVTVAEELSYTQAAQRLHISQPALWEQIRKLEAQVGVELLAREGRSIRLTDAGRIFLQQTRKTLADASMSITLARRAARGEIGHLSIGHNNPAEFLVLRKIVPAFKKQWPDVHLTFHSLSLSQQIEALLRDELDLALHYWQPAQSEKFDVQELVREPVVAVLPANHRLASAPSVSIKKLSGEPLILFPRAELPDPFREIEVLFRKAGAVMNVVQELETALSVINFVAMGVGCSLLPNHWRRILGEDVVYKPLRHTPLVQTMAMIKKKGKRGLAETFYRFTADNL